MKHFITVAFLLFVVTAFTNAQNWKPAPQSGKDSVDERVFTKVEQEAIFPGGEAGWRKYLMQNLEVEKVARKVNIPKGEKELKETIIVKFIVAKDGSISDVAAENIDANRACIAEAIRVIKTSPNWIPAQQNGRTVNAYSRQSITFLFER